jgi:hypothetical protein
MPINGPNDPVAQGGHAGIHIHSEGPHFFFDRPSAPRAFAKSQTYPPTTTTSRILSPLPSPPPRGAKEKKMKATYIWQMINQVGRYFLFFFLVAVVFSTFLGVSRQGEFENTIKNILAKSPCRKLFPKFRQKFRCQFFLDFFCFVAFSGVFQRWEFKNTTKNVLQKKSCRKVFT